MKKIFAILIALSLTLCVSPSFAQKVYYQDSSTGYKIKIPYTWTYSKNNDSTFFYGKNIILFGAQKTSLSASEKKLWKENHLKMTNDFAFDYAKGFSEGITKIHPIKIKNYTSLPYKSSRIVYKGHSGNTKIKANQVLIVQKKQIYVLTGFAKTKKYKKSNSKYFLPAFKSFRLL